MYLLTFLPALSWSLSTHKTTLQDRLDEVSSAMDSLKKESASLPRSISVTRSSKPPTHTNLKPVHDVRYFLASAIPSPSDQALQAISAAKQNLSSVQSSAASGYSLPDIARQVQQLSQQVSQISQALTGGGIMTSSASSSSSLDPTLVTAIAAGADATTQQKVDINILKANLAALNSSLSTMMVTLDGEISDTQDTLSSSMNMRFQALSNQLDQVTATVAGTSPTTSPIEAEITSLSDRVSALEAAGMNTSMVTTAVLSASSESGDDSTSTSSSSSVVSGILSSPSALYSVYAVGVLLVIGLIYYMSSRKAEPKDAKEEVKEEASPTAGTAQSEEDEVSPSAPRQDLVEEEIA